MATVNFFGPVIFGTKLPDKKTLADITESVSKCEPDQTSKLHDDQCSDGGMPFYKTQEYHRDRVKAQFGDAGLSSAYAYQPGVTFYSNDTGEITTSVNETDVTKLKNQLNDNIEYLNSTERSPTIKFMNSTKEWQKGYFDGYNSRRGVPNSTPVENQTESYKAGYQHGANRFANANNISRPDDRATYRQKYIDAYKAQDLHETQVSMDHISNLRNHVEMRREQHDLRNNSGVANRTTKPMHDKYPEQVEKIQKPWENYHSWFNIACQPTTNDVQTDSNVENAPIESICDEHHEPVEKLQNPWETCHYLFGIRHRPQPTTNDAQTVPTEPTQAVPTEPTQVSPTEPTDVVPTEPTQVSPTEPTEVVNISSDTESSATEEDQMIPSEEDSHDLDSWSNPMHHPTDYDGECITFDEINKELRKKRFAKATTRSTPEQITQTTTQSIPDTPTNVSYSNKLMPSFLVNW